MSSCRSRWSRQPRCVGSRWRCWHLVNVSDLVRLVLLVLGLVPGILEVLDEVSDDVGIVIGRRCADWIVNNGSDADLECHVDVAVMSHDYSPSAPSGARNTGILLRQSSRLPSRS